MSQNSKWIHYVDTICFRKWNKLKKKSRLMLQSRTKLLEKVFPIMCTFLRNKTISKTTPLRKKKTLPLIQCCFPQTPRDQAFLWIHNNIAFRGRGRGKNRYSYDVSKNAVQVYNFPNSFVQDCRKGASLFWEEWWSIDPLKTPKQTNKRTSSVSSSLSN